MKAAARTMAATLVLCLSCNESSLSHLDAIYGEDDRRELIDVDVSEASVLQPLFDASVLLVNDSDLTMATSQASVTLNTISYGESYGLCRDERFFQQPTAGFCTGIIVGRNLVATAGHCVLSDQACKTTRFIRGYRLDQDRIPVTTIRESNVTGCEKIIDRFRDPLSAEEIVLLRTKIPFPPNLPIGVSPLSPETNELMIVGYPRGLPAKFVHGPILSRGERSLRAAIDTFVGNSGSPVFDFKKKAVIGVLTRGASDFEPAGPCLRERHCQDSCTGELVNLWGPLLTKIPPQEGLLTIEDVSFRINTETRPWVEPGEEGVLSLHLRNNGNGTFAETGILLRSANSIFNIEQPSHLIPELQWNEDTFIETPFTTKMPHATDSPCSASPLFVQNADTRSILAKVNITPGKAQALLFDSLTEETSLSSSNTEPSTSFTRTVKLPKISRGDSIHLKLQLRVPTSGIFTIAVKPPQSRIWSIQQIGSGSPTGGPVPIQTEILEFDTKHSLPYQSLDDLEKPIVAGDWQIKLSYPPSAAQGFVNQMSLIVLITTCQSPPL